MNRVLVTGGSGFIGQHVTRALANEGYGPMVFDHYAPPKRNPCFFGDIRDATAVTEAAAHCEAIIHLAGVLGTQETIANPGPAAETNILGGLNILDAARQYQLPVVYIAVGNHWMDNSYSITKTTVERFCRMYRAEHDLTVSVVRVMNAYGPGQVPCAPYGPSKVRKIMPSFICRALAGDPVEVYGDGMQIMDMVHVSDVAHTLVEALGTNGDFECGTGRPTTVSEIAQEVLANCEQGTLDFLPMRPGEPESSVVLANPDRWLIPFSVSLEDGVADTVDWYRKHWLPTWRP